MEQCSPWGQCFLQVPVALWMETCNGEGHPMRNYSWEVSLLSQLAERSSGHGRQRRESNNLSRTEKKQGTETAPSRGISPKKGHLSCTEKERRSKREKEKGKGSQWQFSGRHKQTQNHLTGYRLWPGLCQGCNSIPR